jgi:hypothetical protein
MRARYRAPDSKTTYGNLDAALDQQSRPPATENTCFPAEIARMIASKKGSADWSR